MNSKIRKLISICILLCGLAILGASCTQSVYMPGRSPKKPSMRGGCDCPHFS